jgi:hypothetical protein
VRGYAHSAVENLHHLRRQVSLQLLVHQRIRHAVEVPANLDVIVDVDAGGFPFAELEARSRPSPFPFYKFPGSNAPESQRFEQRCPQLPVRPSTFFTRA